MSDWDVLTPQNLSELHEMLSLPSRKLIAGGTDLIPRLHRARIDEPVELIDMSRLSELHFIRENAGQIEIGALVAHTTLFTSPLLLQCAPALSKACGSIGSPQTRARGTLGGNLVNASPAADSAPPLLCLNTTALISGPAGQRQVALADFFCGPGRTCLQPGEYLHSLRFAAPAGRWGMAFAKLGRRNGMAIAVVSTCVYLELGSSGRIDTIRIAMGSVAPTPVRCPQAEAAFQGAQPAVETFDLAAAALIADISPIDDLRASKEYRLQTAQVLLKRVLADAARQTENR